MAMPMLGTIPPAQHASTPGAERIDAMLSLTVNSWASLPTFKHKAPPSRRGSERSSADSASGSGSGSALPSHRFPEHRDHSHARNNLQLLQDQRGRRKGSTPRVPGHTPAAPRAPGLEDAPVVSAAYTAPGLLDEPDALAVVCGAWAADVGFTSGTGIANILSGGVDSLAVQTFTGGIFGLLFSVVDAGLTICAWREAKKQYQVFESLLGMQHLVQHRLKAHLRHDPDPALQAQWKLAQFNVGVLEGLLKAFEKAYLSPSEWPVAAQGRQLQLEHLVSADEALRLRQDALAYPDDRRQALADRAAQRRDALQTRIAEFDAASQVPLFERMREGLRHPIDLLDGLSDEQVAFLRDGVLQSAKLPFQLFTALSALLSQVIDSGLASAALDTVGDVAGPVGVLLTALGLLTAHWDQDGARKRQNKARAGRRAKLMAFENTVWRLHAASADPHADPEQLKQSRQVCHNVARQLAKAIQRANEGKRVAGARKLRGKLGKLNVLLLGLPGFIAWLAEATADAGIASLVVGGALGLWFLSQLTRYLAYLGADKRRMRRRDKEARAFGDADGSGAARLYAGHRDGEPGLDEARRQALSGNVYLSVGWLQGQLYEVGLQAMEARGGEPPLCDAERILLDAGVPADTLRHLRRAARIKTAQQHGQFVRAVATGALGLRAFLSGGHGARAAGTGEAHEPVSVVRTHAADAIGPFAHLADLDDAVKHMGKRERRALPPVARIVLGIGPKRLATPRQATHWLKRHARRGETQALHELQRGVLEHLLHQLPRRADGLGIDWPERYRRGQSDPDTADCLLAYLEEMQETCRLGDLALSDEQKTRWSDRWMRKRLQDKARLLEQLKDAVRAERPQAAPWWDELIDNPPVFRSLDEQAERGEDGSDDDGFDHRAPGPLPAYAIRV